jgi:hypothetical protein
VLKATDSYPKGGGFDFRVMPGMFPLISRKLERRGLNLLQVVVLVFGILGLLKYLNVSRRLTLLLRLFFVRCGTFYLTKSATTGET